MNKQTDNISDYCWELLNAPTISEVIDCWYGPDFRDREMIKRLIVNACKNGEITYTKDEKYLYMYDFQEFAKRDLIYVNKRSFEKWVSEMDEFKQSKKSAKPAYLNEGHPYHAPELKIAVEAWTALYEVNPPEGKPMGGYRRYIKEWLGKNYPDLGPNARDRIITIVNPNPKGGASRSKYS